MSTAEVIALIDAVLARPVSDGVRNVLRPFRAQIQAGTIADDDRNYVINFCGRLQRAKDETRNPSVTGEADDKRAPEDAEDRRRRIECLRQTGQVFESTADLKWLYFKLMLHGAVERSEKELAWALNDFVWEPIWESVFWRDSGYPHSESLVEQATRYIDRPLFHCTALRDFFIVRLAESPMHVDNPNKGRFAVWILVLFPLGFVNWWATAIMGLLLATMVWRWRVRNRFIRDKIREITATLKRGGFDERTVIRQLQKFDCKSRSRPPVSIYSVLGLDPPEIPIPGVLYALLRLPRRNVENEISTRVLALDQRERDELWRRWRNFVDPKLTLQ
jgi:hypothetical protein